MATLYIVRHGQAAAGFDGHPDPGLSDRGRQQAEAVCGVLAPLGPLPILSSPLARARETARPLEAVWGTQATIEPRMGEIPSPTPELAARAAWLRRVMAGRWDDLDETLQQWRAAVLECLLGVTGDAVLFSHFIAINAAVAAATAAQDMIVFRPDNASVTVLSNATGALEVLRLGAQADTEVR